MSDSKHTLKDRFSDFEPEVTENAIDQNWQNIKGKLSLEKASSKKRRFLFLGIYAIITFNIIAILSVLTFNTNTPSLTSKKQSHTNIHPNENITEQNHSEKHNALINTQQNINQNDSEQSDVDSLINKDILTSEKTSKNIEKSNFSAKSTKNQSIIPINQQNKTVLNNSVNTIKNANNSKNQNDYNNGNNITNRENKENKSNNFISQLLKINNKDSLQKDPQDIPNFNNDKNTLNNPIAPNNILNNENNQFFSNLIIPNITCNLPKDTLEYNIIYYPLTTNLIEDYNPNSTTKNKLSLEILMGSAFSKNSILYKHDEILTTNKTSIIGLSGSIGLNWQLSSKGTIHGQYIFNNNKFSSINEETNRIELYKYTSNYFSTPDSSFVTDTITKHLNYEKTYKLQSIVSHQFALGYSYRVIDFKKTFIEASVMFNVKQSKYNYERNTQLSDTINYSSPITISNDTIPFTISTSYPSTDEKETLYSVKNYSSLSAGLLPALTFGCRISNKTDLILRGLYYIDLLDNKIHNQDLIMKIKQNTLFLHFGIRIKL